MADLMIEAKGLTKQYGSFTALSDASFDVQSGEVIGLLGPNGAGKSTTMKILTCFIAPSDGTARVMGADVFDEPMKVRRAIGYLPESNPLYTEMLTLEYLQWVGEMRGLDKETTKKRIKSVVEETSLGDVIAKEIRTLSKGYRQRVGLAQALLHEPPILILDEPMSGLDPNQATEIRDLIREIGKERTVILSTHHLSEVQATCTRVLIIAKGKLVADDTPEGLQGSAGKTRFSVGVLKNGKSEDEVKAILQGVKGVDQVRLDEPPKSVSDGEIHFSLLPTAKDDLRPEIFRAAVDGGITLVELRRQEQNLEGVFRQLTQSE